MHQPNTYHTHKTPSKKPTQTIDHKGNTQPPFLLQHNLLFSTITVSHHGSFSQKSKRMMTRTATFIEKFHKMPAINSHLYPPNHRPHDNHTSPRQRRYRQHSHLPYTIDTIAPPELLPPNNRNRPRLSCINPTPVPPTGLYQKNQYKISKPNHLPKETLPQTPHFLRKTSPTIIHLASHNQSFDFIKVSRLFYS